MYTPDTVPSGQGFVALLEAFRASGGTAPDDIIGPLLADHHVGDAISLAALVHSGQLFGFEWRRSFWIPMFQFDANDLSIAAAPQRVRAELSEMGSGWAVAQWFASGNAELDGRRPVDCLSSDVAAVLRAARAIKASQDVSFQHAMQSRQVTMAARAG